MRGLRVLACCVALATVALVTTGLLQVLEVLPSEQEDWIPLAIYPFLALAILSPAVVGLLIALQLPRNPIAWILLLGALLPALQLASEQIVGAAWSYQTEEAAGPLLLLVWPLAVAFVFPNGRLLSRRWRWVAGAGDRELRVHDRTEAVRSRAVPAAERGLTNPLLGNAVGEFILDTGVWIPFAIGVLASLFAGALSVILRFRRSVGVERLQMQWLVWGASLTPLVLVLEIVMSSWFGGGGATTFVLLLVAQFAFVAAIGIAVVRYRLYAIERLVNRTLVYVTLTLLLLARLRGDHDRARRRGRRRLGVGRRAGDARRRACVPPAARAHPGSRRPAVPTGTLRGRPSASARSRTRCATAPAPPRRSAPCSPRRCGIRSRRSLFWIPETGAYADATGETGSTSSRTTSARSGRSDATTRGRPCSSTIRRCSSGATSSTASSPRPRSRSRWRVCASRCACSSPRSRPRARASSRQATRSAAVSSATSTTAPSSGSSRSACRSGASS